MAWAGFQAKHGHFPDERMSPVQIRLVNEKWYIAGDRRRLSLTNSE
jgi:hypothetical protein